MQSNETAKGKSLIFKLFAGKSYIKFDRTGWTNDYFYATGTGNLTSNIATN
jgi:hypothetical protein